MNTGTPRMKEAWARSSRTADGFYSSTTPAMVYAHSCYEEGCKLENELTDVTAQRDRLAKACDQYSEDEILCKLQTVTAQRDMLAEALELFIEEQCENRPHEHSDALGNARKALQSLTPKP
jgi:hypothetical protein